MEDLNKTTVIIQSSVDINQNDVDLIVMFFESKKQSGGGDTISSELFDKKLLKLVYEKSESKQRILEKKYFSFKKYFFKSFEFNVNGYKFDSYDLRPKQLIIKGILDSEFDPSNIDDSVTKMYAEHLSPDNDVLTIHKSDLFVNTFFVTYKNDLDRDQIKARYNKKPKLRNQELTILDSYDLKSLVIAASRSNVQTNCLHDLAIEIRDEIEKKGAFEENKFFLDLDQNYIIFQCEDPTILNKTHEFIKFQLKNDCLTVEECLNFKLLEFVQPIKNESAKTNEKVAQPQVNQYIQTEVIELKMETKIVSTLVTEEDKTTKKELPKTSKEKPAKNVKKAKTPIQESNEDKLNIEKVKMDDFYLDNLFKSQTDNEIVLNEEAPLSIGLINCAQLRADLDQQLKSFSTELYFNKKNKYKTLSIKFDKESKIKVVNVVKNFAKIHFLYKIVHLPASITNDTVLMDALVNYIPNMNKQYPGIYLKLVQNSINCYGYPKSLGKVLDTNCGLLKDLIEKRSSGNLEQPKTVEKPKNVTPQKTPETSKNKTASKQTTPSKREDTQPKLQESSQSFSQLIDDKEWKKVAPKPKKEEPTYKDVNKIILYSSYEPVQNITTEDPQKLTQPNYVFIDPQVFHVLSICLLKCHQVVVDFMNDLKTISPICHLVYVNDKENNPELSYVKIDSLDPKYIETYKAQLDKLMNYYEKNRLKHVYNLIDEKLQRDDIFPTLIQNFSSKNELNDLKIILDMIYNNDKVLHAQLVDKKIIEIYGYTNAVQNYDTYALEILSKTINYFNNSLNNLLAFKLFMPNDNPKLSVFFKFNGFYFTDFANQISICDAHVVKLDEQRALHFACYNKKLRNNPKKLDLIEKVYEWRKNVEDFINQYLELFSIEQLRMPFSRDSEECKNILYDKNILDLVWLDDRNLEIVGLTEEIKKFKMRIF